MTSGQIRLFVKLYRAGCENETTIVISEVMNDGEMKNGECLYSEFRICAVRRRAKIRGKDEVRCYHRQNEQLKLPSLDLIV